MSTTKWMPPPMTDYAAAKYQYVERYGSVAVMNTYLKIALLSQSVVALGLIALTMHAYTLSRSVKPLVVRINDIGQAEAVNYGGLDYHPQEAEIKYFLDQFVQQYYGRMHATVKENFTHSLYFLDGHLADAAIESNRKTKAIETFLTSQETEIDIRVKNVAIEDLRQPPYKATVDFEKIYYDSAHGETHRRRYAASFFFVVKQPVPSALVPFNPLGLTITYFHENEAFETSTQE